MKKKGFRVRKPHEWQDGVNASLQVEWVCDEVRIATAHEDTNDEVTYTELALTPEEAELLIAVLQARPRRTKRRMLKDARSRRCLRVERLWWMRD
jgi:hypothetical protein